ncbi:alpha/beta hydrolase [Paenibacillus naphthalenovorans]|uniref:alpha/beta hydrolase n=1 Tax=Paenibacillus naphthalenovorans TaxID=162209 RepID=UPI00088906E5|nr:alpha/beta hydrolase [Paenibacillus naphthalenovorans]SDJ30034.1 Fermentation-respiration switch protein FrsA, has esterase activity, DUF1100 family [Paenibacillus naphthalenovorans]
MRTTPLIPRVPGARRSRKKIWLWTAGLLLFVFLACAGIAAYVGWQLTHPGPAALDDSPDRLGLAYENVQFKSRGDDITLKGWFLPGKTIDREDSGKTGIIMTHGYRTNRLQKSAEALDLAKRLTDRGYRVFMFDFRNSGESEGSKTTIGFDEKYDVLGAIDWMKANHPGKIALLGYSMGASTSLIAAAEEPGVSGVIADSPFNHLRLYLEDHLSVWSNLPQFPFTPLILGILPGLVGVDPDQVDGFAAVDRIYPRPILFIHSTRDASIPISNSESLWEKHKDRFDMWATSAEGHARNYPPLKEEYVERVTDFLEKL